MATLREMLVKIYQPNEGIIEFGPGGSTQDGATDLAVLGGGPNQGGSEGTGGGGGVDFPDFRYAGVEGGGGGGTGGFDLSSIDWSDPGQVEMARRWLSEQSREGGQHGEGVGGERSPYGDPAGFGTVGQIGGMFTGIPGLGLLGAGIGAAYDYELANQFDPDYDGSFGSFLSSLGYYGSGGYAGGTQLDEAIGDYQGRTGTGLNRAALAAGVTGGAYSGPKGVAGSSSYDRGGRGAEQSSLGAQALGSAATPGAHMARDVVDRARRDRGGQAGEGGGRGGGGGFGCFVAETMILLPDGSEKPIEEIRPGDSVAAFDGLGALQPGRAVAVMRYQNREPMTVRFAGGSVRVTAEHPFLVPSGEYVRAGELGPGGYVVNADGEGVEVLAVEPATETTDVFNFEVEGLHTYVAAGLRVHNIKHQGGYIDGMPGEEVDETLLAGEYVMSPEAVEMVGPDTFEKINNLARMMRQQHYPARG